MLVRYNTANTTFYNFSALEGGFAAATVLITFGAILGKTNPLQLFFIGIVETTIFCVNSYIGYGLLNTVDGGNLYIYTYIDIDIYINRT